MLVLSFSHPFMHCLSVPSLSSSNHRSFSPFDPSILSPILFLPSFLPSSSLVPDSHRRLLCGWIAFGKKTMGKDRSFYLSHSLSFFPFLSFPFLSFPFLPSWWYRLCFVFALGSNRLSVFPSPQAALIASREWNGQVMHGPTWGPTRAKRNDSQAHRIAIDNFTHIKVLIKSVRPFSPLYFRFRLWCLLPSLSAFLFDLPPSFSRFFFPSHFLMIVLSCASPHPFLLFAEPFSFFLACNIPTLRYPLILLFSFSHDWCSSPTFFLSLRLCFAPICSQARSSLPSPSASSSSSPSTSSSSTTSSSCGVFHDDGSGNHDLRDYKVQEAALLAHFPKVCLRLIDEEQAVRDTSLMIPCCFASFCFWFLC